MNRRAWLSIATLLLPAFAAAEIYLPPDNVLDPARRAKDQLSDPSLPFIYLEPHDFCYDIARPLSVTLSAVNRSGKHQTIDWRAIIGSLVLEPVGPGRVIPAGHRPAAISVALASKDLAQVTIDLRDCFQIEGAAVYRLSYARPLEDGRIHIARPVQFVIEDDAAIDKLAAALDAGPARDTFAALLKENPVFAAGGDLKTYGWDAMEWGNRPRMHHGQWDKALAAARPSWREGIVRLTEKGSPVGHQRALEALLDRLLLISADFRVQPEEQFVWALDARAENHLAPKDRERLHLKLVRSRAPLVVARSMNRLMSMQSEAALDELFRIGDGPDRTLAEKAINSLSSYRVNPRIAQYLRRKMTGDDRGLALEAAIVSCYSGDGAGGSLVVRCLKSDDPALRLKMIAQVFDADYFRSHHAQIVPALLDELKKPTSDAHLESAIDSLRAYPSDEVLKAVTPFQKHQNPQVAQRAQLSVSEILRAKSR